MLPNFLLPESIITKNGTGPAVALGDAIGKQLLLTVGITRIVEQESLDVEVRGSADATNWEDKPLLVFPQKFYTGTYSRVLDLTDRPDIRYVRIDYKVNRWGRGDKTPLFGFYVFAQEAEQPAEVMHAAVA